VLPTVVETLGFSPLFIPKQPSYLYIQDVRESFEFVVKYVAVIVFNLSDRCPIELNAKPGESSRQRVLC
jgi:hypothetical protein